MSDTFAAYKAAALHWAETRCDYPKLEAARAALTTALGYKRVHDHLGEYANLHERDIPGYLKATRVSPLALDRKDEAEGRIWSYNGYCRSVTEGELASMLQADRLRSDELERWFLMAPADKFIAGAVAMYQGALEPDNWYIARFVRGADVPSVRIEQCVEFLSSEFVSQPIMSEHEARNFFANLGEVTFIKFRMSDQRG